MHIIFMKGGNMTKVNIEFKQNNFGGIAPMAL
jgi:hypothetical protein